MNRIDEVVPGQDSPEQFIEKLLISLLASNRIVLTELRVGIDEEYLTDLITGDISIYM